MQKLTYQKELHGDMLDYLRKLVLKAWDDFGFFTVNKELMYIISDNVGDNQSAISVDTDTEVGRRVYIKLKSKVKQLEEVAE